MGTERASIFEADELDIAGFTPKKRTDQTAPAAEAVREVAEAANFRRRETPAEKIAPPKRVPRRHRTGRNVQFNVKVSQETLDAFYAISDQQGWVLGETMEHALGALQKTLSKGK